MRKIYVWPDHNWVFKEDYCENEYRYKGDDFLSMFVEEASDDDEIDRLVAEALGELGRQYRRGVPTLDLARQQQAEMQTVSTD